MIILLFLIIKHIWPSISKITKQLIELDQFLIINTQQDKMNDTDVSQQIQQMVRFIRQEAEEKANEISVSAEEVSTHFIIFFFIYIYVYV